MIRTLKLHGSLRKRFGAEFRFEAASVAELIRAFCRLVPGAQARIERGAFEVLRATPAGRRDVGVERLRFRLGADEREVHLIPRLKGRKRGGVGKIVLGAVLIGVSFLIPPAGLSILGGATAITSAGVAQIGISMALGGLGALLAPTPKAPTPRAREDERSGIFSDAANLPQPGAPIPVLFGRCEVGSVVVSAGMRAERRA